MAEGTQVLKSRAEIRPFAPEISYALDGVARRVAVNDAIDIAFEHCAPVRTFLSWPGKRNYSGSYWSSTTKQHVGFESLYECTALTTLDRDPSIIGISSQPMWIHWPRGRAPKSHAPDYFARRQNGDGEIVDVRPEKLIDEQTAVVFEATRLLCAEAGLRYRVISDLSPELDRNLKFLSPYRDQVWAPQHEAMANLASHRGSVSVLELAQFLAPHDVTLGLGQVYWLIWHRALEVSMNRPLSLRTQIQLEEATAL